MFFRGAQSFAQPLQEPISHLILMGFERRIKSVKSPLSKNIINTILNHEIDNFHDQLRYPFGQICMIEKNLKSSNQTNHYYAVKGLENITNLIDSENFTQMLIKTDPEFRQNWVDAKNLTNNWLNKMIRHEIADGIKVTPSTLQFLNRKNKNNDYVKTNTLECIAELKNSWQIIWRKFCDIKRSFDFILKDKNNADITYGLVDYPPEVDENFFMVAIDELHNVRMWHAVKDVLYKSKATQRPTKWVKVEEIFSTKIPKWWLFAKEKIRDTQGTHNCDLSDDLSENLSTTTIY
jgi:hypothetical protein